MQASTETNAKSFRKFANSKVTSRTNKYNFPYLANSKKNSKCTHMVFIKVECTEKLNQNSIQALPVDAHFSQWNGIVVEKLLCSLKTEYI